MKMISPVEGRLWAPQTEEKDNGWKDSSWDLTVTYERPLKISEKVGVPIRPMF